jgi:guanosine-3',5'-bis(diphosphate) 3'-pyrophosphohydrolase
MPRPTPLWQHAAAFAARAHRHGLRSDGRTPYVAHVFRVAMTVRDVFGCADEAAICAALLHDTIEDTGADYDEIDAAFGREVAGCVAALTKNAALPEREREPEYDARLARADWRARLVKLADVYDNFCDRADRTEPGMAKVVAKCRRALALAQADAPAHEETRRAIDAVRALLATA